MSYGRKIEPTLVQQGEEVAWTRCYTDYPASLWTLEYRIRWVGTGSVNGIDLAATADGDDFDAVISATQSAGFTLTGRSWKWQAWMTEIADSTNKICVNSGYFTVEKGFIHGTLTADDERSMAKKQLDAIDAALLASAGDVVEYELSTPAGMRRVKRSRSEAIEQRKYYAGIVAGELTADRVKAGGPWAVPIKGRFRSW